MMNVTVVINVKKTANWKYEMDMHSSFPADQQSVDDGNSTASERMREQERVLDHSGERVGQFDLAIRFNRILNGSDEV